MNLRDKLLDYFENKLPQHYNSNTIRHYQVQMALDVLSFLQNDNKKDFLILEAPVGTGKSLGALIPALFHKQKVRSSIVYATSTINLQGQLWESEVPLLKKLGLLKHAILAKGKSHYYCHHEFKKNERRYQKYKESFLNFFNTSESGHRNEFEKAYGPISNKDWEGVSFTATKGKCKDCIFSYKCPTEQHRSKFNSSLNELVITNHDQLIQSVFNRYNTDRMQDPIVPINPGIIIIDEAHDFQENFLGRLEKSISIGDLYQLRRDVPNRYKGPYTKILNQISGILEQEAANKEYPQGRFQLSKNLQQSIKQLSKVLDDALITIASRNIDKYRYNEDHNSDKEDGIEEALDTIRKITDSEYVSWVTYEDRKFSTISRLFHSEFIMLLLRLSKFNKVIIMSGTLALNGDFEGMILQWRLDPKEVMTRSLPTSFSYKQQAIIYVPKDLPEGRDNNQEYINARLHHMKSLLKATEGRSLILSTCKKLMESFYNELLPFLSDINIALLKQDNSGVETLTQAFKNDISSVLIGSGSFFSGFSVPGEALISVILTRLPFPVPDDPYLKLIGEGFDDIFFKVITFPNMMVKLNQAVGRLIRDIKDYGVITILDPRIFTMSYGSSIREIFEAMGYRITREFSDVTDFLNRVRNSQEDVIYPEYDKTKLDVSESLLYDEELEKAKRESYRYSYSSFGLRQDTPNKKYKRLPEPEDDSTEEQWGFYHKIRERMGLQYKKLDKLKTARHIYEYLIDLLSKKGMDTGMVENDFPFVNESQKVNFNRFKGKVSPVKTYILSAEELAQYK